MARVHDLLYSFPLLLPIVEFLHAISTSILFEPFLMFEKMRDNEMDAQMDFMKFNAKNTRLFCCVFFKIYYRGFQTQSRFVAIVVVVDIVVVSTVIATVVVVIVAIDVNVVVATSRIVSRFIVV